MRVCFSTAQLSSSFSSPPARSASSHCPACNQLSTSSAVSSRLVPCHRPQLLCNLAPIWSCQSILTAPPTPDSVACLLARSLATRQSHTVHSPTPTSPSHCLRGSQNTSNCLGLLVVGPTDPSPRPSHSHRPKRTGCFRQLGRTGGRAGRRGRRSDPNAFFPPAHRYGL